MGCSNETKAVLLSQPVLTDAIAIETRSTTAPVEQRILDALLRCMGRWGLGKTTLDDVAREAGCSRATVYRAFPGGKAALVAAATEREVVDLLLEVTGRITGAEDLEDCLTLAIVAAGRFLADHDPLGFVVRHEPDLLLPFVAFDQLDPLLAVACGFVAPELSSFMPLDLAYEVVEWSARLLISFMFRPAESMDLTSPAHVGTLVRTFLLPGIAVALDAEPPELFEPPEPSETRS